MKEVHNMRLLNRYEEITYDRLSAITEENDAHVFAKVRIADVLPLSKGGLSGDLFGFGLKSHFDFTVTNNNYEPLFAVEFDGPPHTISTVQTTRDRKKNEIAKLFEFPLLRINSRYVDRKYRGLDLLTYFTEIWFLREAFYQAQLDGHVPYDGPFDPAFIAFDGKRSNKFPYWLSLNIQLEIEQIKKEGRIKDHFISNWVGVDVNDNHHCLSWLHVSDNAVLLARTGMREQLFPADISDILWQVSTFDIKRELDSFLKGETKGMPLNRFEKILLNYQNHYKMLCFAGHCEYR